MKAGRKKREKTNLATDHGGFICLSEAIKEVVFVIYIKTHHFHNILSALQKKNLHFIIV